ncbi:PIN domain-containing protein [Hymenobacter sp. YC55]|uniref:PIN domain-containing protein n=1 Tax=Hymenobacter sp. YC55 TaxID=3034019 RepID=UPI0023F8E24A|nr:PIN domain-containing protein [Hymenobacter sp. YC55]MDF7811392.1 PIN domain-containing protein [Hymenobacter sp. YC55]
MQPAENILGGRNSYTDTWPAHHCCHFCESAGWRTGHRCDKSLSYQRIRHHLTLDHRQFFYLIQPSTEELAELWDDCIFTFDTNILLNFYRYKTETTNNFFEILAKLKEKSCMAHQAIEEYLGRRLDVISEQGKTYSDFISDLQNVIEQPLTNSRRHPYISHELLDEFLKSVSSVKAELTDRNQKYSKRLTDDEILSRIINLFEEKVGEPFSDTKLIDHYKEADKRYKDKIPPGFEDIKKEGNRKYGDYILWLQIIDISLASGKNIVFVSDDEKKDWILSHKGKKIGLLPELRKEFNILTGKKIHIYNASQFLDFAGKTLGTQVPEEAIKDVKSFQTESRPILEADLIWESSGRSNQGFSQKNRERFGDEPIMAGSPLIVFWKLDWYFKFTLHNNSSFPAYNIKIEHNSDVLFSFSNGLPTINNLAPFANLELEARTHFFIEGDNTGADNLIHERIPKHLNGLQIKISYKDESRKEYVTLVEINNGEITNEQIK